MASTHNWIPVELLMKIFLPQPVKSLLRLRCVCKLWNQVITSKSFIKAHLDHQKTTSSGNKYLLLDYCSIILVDNESYNVLESHDCNTDCIFGNEPRYRLDEVYGICNGLVCLSDRQDSRVYGNQGSCRLHGSIYLWNPIVNKGKKLPPLGIGFEVKHAWHTYLCFGYHDDDYKVIKIAPFPHMYHVYIYSLSTDCWDFFEIDIAHDGVDDSNDIKFDIMPYPQARLVNGVAYFVKESFRNLQFHRVLVSFDLSCELIKEIDVPEDFKSNSKFRIEEYEESIALIGFQGDVYNEEVLVMWVLHIEPSDKSFSWDKKYTIEPLEKYCFQMRGFINNDKLVISRMPRYEYYRDRGYACCPSLSKHYKYFLYNVNNVDHKIGHELRISEYGTNRDIYSLEENLVLLNETTVHPFVETQSCSSNATGRRKEENKDKVIHRQRIAKGSTTRIILSHKFKEISSKFKD